MEGHTLMRVTLVELAYFREMPENMEGWRNFRIEYYKDGMPFAENKSGFIHLPPDVNPATVELCLQSFYT